MQNELLQKRLIGRYKAVFAFLALLLFCTSCTEIRLISDYDEETDRAVAALQKKVETLLTSLEKTLGTNEGAFSNYEDDYDEIKIDLSSLQVRADSRPKNQIQIDQLAEIAKQLALFEQAHKAGMDKAEIPPFRNGFNQSFRAIITLELAKKRGES